MKNRVSFILALTALFYLGEAGAQRYVPPPENAMSTPPLENYAFPLPYPYWNYYPDYDEYNSPSYNQQQTNPEEAAFPYHPL